MARNRMDRSQVYLRAFDPSQLYNLDEPQKITKKITGDVAGGRAGSETTWERVEKERHQRKFDEQLMGRAEKFKAAFSKFDVDGDGKLTFDEFSSGLRKLGLRLPDGEVRAIWGHEASKEGSGGRKWKAMEDEIAAKSKDLHWHERQGGLATQSLQAGGILSPQTRHNVMKKPSPEERKRQAVHRQMIKDWSHKASDIETAFNMVDRHGKGQLSFGEYKSCMRKLGVFLGEEDLVHLWDKVAEPQTRSTSQWDAGSMGGDARVVTLNRFTESLGIRGGANGVSTDMVYASNQDANKKDARRMNLVRQRLKDQIRDKRQQLLQAFLISDEQGSGKLQFDDFQTCMRSAGLQIGETDCRSFFEEASKGPAIDYTTFLNKVTISNSMHMSPPHGQRSPPQHRPASPRQNSTMDDEISEVNGVGTKEALFRARVRQTLGHSVTKLKQIFGQPQGHGCTQRSIPLREFKAGLACVGVFVDDKDAAELLQAAATDAQGRLDIDKLTPHVEQHMSNIGFNKGDSLPTRKGVFVPYASSESDGPFDFAHALKRVGRSRVGNPRKLATMFRRYDTARIDRVSLQEFAQVMLDCDLDLSRAEAMQLAQVMDAGDGSVEYAAFVDAVAHYQDSQKVSQETRNLGEVSPSKEEVDAKPRPSQSRQVQVNVPTPVGDSNRCGWIEEVARNAFKDINRFERTREKALSRPKSTLPPKVLHLKEAPRAAWAET